METDPNSRTTPAPWEKKPTPAKDAECDAWWWDEKDQRWAIPDINDKGA